MSRQQMASLPKSRVTASPPFLSSGLDYCGPFEIRYGSSRSRTTVKTYVAIFICMATKAVHMELAHDLSFLAFLNLFARFTSRRGPCQHLYSDNGTAFVGANRIMRQDLKAWKNSYMQQQEANLGISWHFIAPGAPHQGELWEAAVKSAKKHLVRVVGTQRLFDEEFNTLITRIEACLNSRPLIALHDNIDDQLALTPADFLIGRSLVSTSEADIPDAPENRLKHWQLLRQMHHRFWQRWHDEYLVSLQQRTKWQKPEQNLMVNNIVVARDENLPPTLWLLGRIVAVHPGPDGQ